jgi:hypothetical protein
MRKVRKTAHELDAIVRAEAVRVIGPWPVGLRMLIFPLGDNWRATFSLEHLGLGDCVCCQPQVFDPAGAAPGDQVSPPECLRDRPLCAPMPAIYRACRCW